MESKLCEAVIRIAEEADKTALYSDIPCVAQEFIVWVKDIARAALKEPLRNCDVGTASEQYQRFLKYCKKNTGGCNRADRRVNPCAYCFSQWAQMPDNESEANNGEVS